MPTYSCVTLMGPFVTGMSTYSHTYDEYRDHKYCCCMLVFIRITIINNSDILIIFEYHQSVCWLIA